MDQQALAKRAPSPIVPGMGTISAIGHPARMSRLIPTHGWEGIAVSSGILLSKCIETRHAWTGTHTVQRGEMVRVLV